jgi:hypothetical protein
MNRSAKVARTSSCLSCRATMSARHSLLASDDGQNAELAVVMRAPSDEVVSPHVSRILGLVDFERLECNLKLSITFENLVLIVVEQSLGLAKRRYARPVSSPIMPHRLSR